MTGNAVAVGKKLGVAPTLARRTPAAGRNGKRLLTGEQKNLNEVIGKGLLDGVREALKGRRAAKAPMDLRHAHVDPLTPGGLKLPTKHPYLPGDASRGQLPPKSSAAEPRAYPKGVSYREPRLKGFVAKAAPDTGGLGTLVPAMRGQARNSLVPQTSVTASGAQKGSKLASFGGTKPSTAGLSGVAGSTSGGSAGSGSGSTGGGAAGGVGKLASLGVLEGGLKGLKSGFGGWKDSAKTIGMGRAPRTAHTVGYKAGQGLGIAAANPAATAVGAGAGGLAVYGSRKAVGKAAKLKLKAHGYGGEGHGYGYFRRAMDEDSPAGQSYRAGMKHGKKAVREGSDAPQYGGYTDAGVRAGKRIESFKQRGISKRRYDPEDERRHRQGALSATAALGGAALTDRGVREVRSDTRNAKQTGQAARGLYPVRPPQHDSGLGWPKAKSEEEKAQRALGRQQAYERESELFARHQKAVSRIRNPKALKGAVVTGRSGGKVGAGLALMGAGATLYSRRREARYD